MAGPLDPFNPGPTVDPIASLPGADTFSQLRQQWDTFLAQPGAQTALLQFGISMMQPPGFGDTPISQFGRALGSAGEAVGRQEEMARKERESESKVDLQEARGEAARARAAAAGSAADVQRERLAATYAGIEQRREANRLTQQLRGLQAYQTYRKEVENRNAKAQNEYEKNKLLNPKAPPPTPERVMTQEEFATNPLARPFYEGLGMPMGGGTVGAAPGPTPGATVAVQSVVPPNPKDRIVGQTYMTPKGPKTWFEDGWE